jgi:CRP-like cAMP-binding protein
MKSTKNIHIRSGKIFIHENDVSRKLFILRKGRVRVYKSYMGGKITLAILGPGEIFGELSFFDSKPRSASVEALTDVHVDCIDGEQLSDDIKSLPTWVHSVFKSVATRFRTIDQQMAVYQSLNNFKRKTLATEAVGSTIYSDLLRITKILKMILHEKGNPQNRDDLLKELEQTFGTSYITPKGYLRALFEHDIFTLNSVENELEVEIDETELLRFESFLLKQFERDVCTVLDHYALGLMRTVISFLGQSSKDNTEQDHIEIATDALNITDDDEEKCEAFNQLKRLSILIDNCGNISIDAKEIVYLFKYHSIIKSFDDTVIYED